VRKKKVKSQGVASERHLNIEWGWRKSIILLEGFQASPACPSDRNSLKIEIYEVDLRMVTAVT
jgi:hypothetical protein